MGVPSQVARRKAMGHASWWQGDVSLHLLHLHLGLFRINPCIEGIRYDHPQNITPCPGETFIKRINCCKHTQRFILHRFDLLEVGQQARREKMTSKRPSRSYLYRGIGWPWTWHSEQACQYSPRDRTSLGLAGGVTSHHRAVTTPKGPNPCTLPGMHHILRLEIIQSLTSFGFSA
jgi:hypothetical protein